MIDINKFKENLKKLKLSMCEREDIVFSKNMGTNDKIKLKDDSNYWYSLSQGNLVTLVRRNGIPACFFNKNPYTYENINNYFKINDIKLRLITQNPKNAICDLKFMCTTHNIEFERSWNSVKNGSIGCYKCTGITHYEYDAICKVVKEKGCELISDRYNTVHEDYTFECGCGNKFTRRMDLVIYKDSVKCKECMGINVYTNDSVSADLINHDIVLLSKYKSVNENIKIQYNCGHITARTYTNIKYSDYECPYCNKKGYKRNTESFYKEVYDLVGDEYTFFGEYINCDTKMKVKHNICNNEYFVSPHKFINGNRRCPFCTRTSQPEFYIRSLLDNWSINYVEQFEYKDLLGMGNKPLRFDFTILDKNNNISYQLEYDGEYHYNPILGVEKLKYQQNHDNRKDEYCINKNIKLIRIPYWELDNVKNILNDILINNNGNNEFIINRRKE